MCKKKHSHARLAKNAKKTDAPSSFIKPIKSRQPPTTMFDSMACVAFAIALSQEENAQREEKNRYRRERWASLSPREKDEHIRNRSLLPPSVAPWASVYRSRSDRAYLTLTGLNVEAFDKLHNAFAPVFNTYMPYSDDGMIRRLNPGERWGRPRIVKVMPASAWC